MSRGAWPRLIDRPRRRLSVLRRLVWPFRPSGAVASLCPPLGDRVVVRLTRGRSATHGTAEEARMILARARDFLEMIKFSHTLFALPFALLGAVLAAFCPDGRPTRLQDWLGILLCMATARSAAMAFNRLADRSYDALNPRTAARHLPAGRLSVRAVAALHDRLRRRPSSPRRSCSCRTVGRSYLSVPVLLWLLGYSYAKRFTSLAHFWLGLSLSLAPIAAWIALRGDLGWPPVFLADGRAALGRRLRHHLRLPGRGLRPPGRPAQHPRRLRRPGRPRGSRPRCHALMIVPLVVLGLIYPLGTVYFLGVAAVAVLLIYEHALVRPDDLTRVNVAFFQVNIVISIGLLVVGVIDLLIHRVGRG